MPLPQALAVAQNVRSFLEPLFMVHSKEGDNRTTPSQGHCFSAAQVLAHALNAHFGGGWSACEGVFATPEVLAQVGTGELCTWSDIEDAGQHHGWVVSLGEGGYLLDVTADQFGKPEVVALPVGADEAAHWMPRRLDTCASDDELATSWIQAWDARAPSSPMLN